MRLNTVKKGVLNGLLAVLVIRVFLVNGLNLYRTFTEKKTLGLLEPMLRFLRPKPKHRDIYTQSYKILIIGYILPNEGKYFTQ